MLATLHRWMPPPLLAALCALGGWALHRAWPEAEMIITPDSGHSAFEPGNSRALVAATDRFAAL